MLKNRAKVAQKLPPKDLTPREAIVDINNTVKVDRMKIQGILNFDM